MSKVFTVESVSEAYFDAWYDWQVYYWRVFEPFLRMVESNGVWYCGYHIPGEEYPSGRWAIHDFMVDPWRLWTMLNASMHPVVTHMPIDIVLFTLDPTIDAIRLDGFSFVDTMLRSLSERGLPQNKSRKRGVWKAADGERNRMLLRIPHR